MSADARLTKTEKNGVHKLVVAQGFDPADFEWSEQTTQDPVVGRGVYWSSVLTHFPTGYYFRFGGGTYEWSLGETQRVDSWSRPEHEHERFNLVSGWLGRVRREYDAPDLWAMALEDRNFLQAASGLEGANTEFSSDERTYISARLDAIRDFVLDSADLANEQRELIAAQFEYVKEATNRLGRTDWKAVLVGAFFTIAVAATVTPDLARQVWHMIAEAFTPLYKVVGGLIP